MADIANRLREDAGCLRKMVAQAGFASSETGVRVKKPDLLLAVLDEAADEIDRLRALVSSSEAERYRSGGELLAALDAAHKRIAALDAALIMNPMAERIADLPDFMAALSEWGCEDPNEQADEIAKFLNSTVGLREYLEDQSKVGGRDGN